MPDDRERRERLIAKKSLWAAQGRSPSGEPDDGSSPPLKRHPRLPPGQHVPSRWPVLDLGIKPDVTRETWELDVEGVRDGPLVLRWGDLIALPQTDAVSDFHCVTAWSVLDCRWRGVRFRDFAAAIAPDPAARFVVFGSYDGYTTNLPLDVCMADDVLLVHGYDGNRLGREHGGPVRVVVPSRYAWKSCKWLKSVAFSAVDQPGFWETRGYHNEADPWKEERFA